MGRLVIYVDANVVIRLIEGDAATRAPLEAKLKPLRGTGPFLMTSQLTRLECRVLPIRAGNVELLKLYDQFFAAPELALLDLTTAVVEKASILRASLNLKTPDALHAASAILAGAVTFLSADCGFTRCSELSVEVV